MNDARQTGVGMTALTVVVGGSRGIGAAICRRLALGGHDVVIGFRRDRSAAELVARDVVSFGRQALVVQVDATDEASVIALFEAASEFGTLTGLVNSAGSVSAVGPLEGNDLGAVWRDVEVNLLGVLTTCKHAIAPMVAAGGGAIVNISSAAATLGSPWEYVHYAAAKLRSTLSPSASPRNWRHRRFG